MKKYNSLDVVTLAGRTDDITGYDELYGKAWSAVFEDEEEVA